MCKNYKIIIFISNVFTLIACLFECLRQISYVSPIILFFKNESLGDLHDKIRAIKNVSLNSCMGFLTGNTTNSI